MGGTDASADAILAGAEDVVRRGRGQGHGAGNTDQGVAEHQNIQSGKAFHYMDLHHRLASVSRQAEAHESHRRYA